MSSTDVIIRARALTKKYGQFTAVDGIDFDVRGGECVGFLGPNGAGKTTTVRMISCYTPITSGTAHVFGMDVSENPRKIKARIGICPQEDNLDPDFSVEKNLLVYARYFQIPGSVVRKRASDLLSTMQLTEKSDAKIQELSGGMKRRLILARALLNTPQLLLLDEPTTGLDPQARHMIWQRIRNLTTDGVTILLTTHYMEEAARLCDRVILMDQGRILLRGGPAELVGREVGREVLEIWNHTREVTEFIEGNGWKHEVIEDRLHVFLPPGVDGGRMLGERFPHQEHLLRHASLEDVFLLKTGRTLKD
jgi:lipooligosaccharide transport system ATP-binding protein